MGLTTRLTAVIGLVVLGGYLVLLTPPVTVSSPPTVHELVTLALLLAVGEVIVFWVIRRSLSPLQELADTMRTTNHPSDYIPAWVTRRDEIGQLAQSLQTMMLRIAEERDRVGRRSLQAQEEERSRIARELHDEVGQDLTLLMLEIVALSKSVDPTTASHLQGPIEQMRAVIDEVRSIATRLRPGALDDLGLKGALQALINDFQRQTPIRIDLRWTVSPRLDAEQELVLYRVTQEALTNVVRHAGATRVEVQLTREGDALVLHIHDDGRGISGEPRAGIEGMHERARLVRGHFEISPRAGGTTVRLIIPENAGADR